MFLAWAVATLSIGHDPVPHNDKKKMHGGFEVIRINIRWRKMFGLVWFSVSSPVELYFGKFLFNSSPSGKVYSKSKGQEIDFVSPCHNNEGAYTYYVINFSTILDRTKINTPSIKKSNALVY